MGLGQRVSVGCQPHSTWVGGTCRVPPPRGPADALTFLTWKSSSSLRVCTAGRRGAKRTPSLGREGAGQGRGRDPAPEQPPGLAWGPNKLSALRPRARKDSAGWPQTRCPGRAGVRGQGPRHPRVPGLGQWEATGGCSPGQGLPVNQLQDVPGNVKLGLAPLQLLLRDEPGQRTRGHSAGPVPEAHPGPYP